MSSARYKKRQMALGRLRSGQLLYRGRDGRWSFGGSIFLPDRVAQRLPLEEAWTDSDGRIAFRIDPRETDNG